MTPSPHNQSQGVPLWMPIVGLFSAAISYFWMQEDVVTAAVIVAVVAAGFSGYRMGAVKLAGLFAGAAVAFAYAPSWGKMCEPNVAEVLGATGLTTRIVSIGAIGIGITLGAMIVVSILSRGLLDDRPQLEVMNRWVGFLLGGAQGTGVMLLLIGGMLTVEPMAKERLDLHTADGQIAEAVSERIVKVVRQTRLSHVGPIAIAYNPFQHVPQLARMQESVKIVRDPRKMNRLLESPKIEQLKQRPAMRRAIDSLTADAEIQQVLRSGGPLDMQSMLSLMNNPTIMKLLDEPDFVGEMTTLLNELDLAP